MADAGAGRNDAEILERLLTPFEEAVTFAVALIFLLHVLGEGARGAKFVDDDRVVDDEVDGNQRVDLFRITAERDHRVAHGSEVDHSRNAGEVLHENACGTVGDLVAVLALVVEPGGDGFDIGLLDRIAVFVAQKVLEQNLHRIGQSGNALQSVLFGLCQAEIGIIFTVNRQG